MRAYFPFLLQPGDLRCLGYIYSVVFIRLYDGVRRVVPLVSFCLHRSIYLVLPTSLYNHICCSK